MNTTIHIGDHIAELLEENKMSKQEFSNRMSLSTTETEDLLNGKTQVTSELARQLQNIFDVPNTFWIGLQKLYNDRTYFDRGEDFET